MYHVPLVLQYMKDGGGENGDGKEGVREWRLLVLLFTDDLILCGKLEEDLRAMVECFIEVCRRRFESQCR